VEEVDPGSPDSGLLETPVALRYNNTKRKSRLQQFRDKQNQSRSKIKDPDALAAIKQGLKVTNYEEHQIE
jgi:hypothetical protein